MGAKLTSCSATKTDGIRRREASFGWRFQRHYFRYWEGMLCEERFKLAGFFPEALGLCKGAF